MVDSINTVTNNWESDLENLNNNDCLQIKMKKTRELLNGSDNNKNTGNSNGANDVNESGIFDPDENGYYLELNNLGITIENSQEFFSEYMKGEGINDYSEIKFLKPLNEDIKIHLFGDIYPKIENIIGNSIRLEDGLKFNFLKNKLGDQQFQLFVSELIDNGLLTTDTMEYSFDNIVLSDITTDDFPKYIELCRYFKDNRLYLFPNSVGFNLDEYLNIVKTLNKDNVLSDFIKKSCWIDPIDGYALFEYKDIFNACIKNCIDLQKNNIPTNAIVFFRIGKFLSEEGVDTLTSMYKELFDNKEGQGLFQFLLEYPQKLENLGGKVVKEIELSAKPDGYNFCFRGILEMIKSRTDLKAPILGENPTNDEKEKWKADREMIIKEYESVLRNYISMDYDEDGIEIPRKQSFDKIFFANENTDGALSGLFSLKDVLKKYTNKFEDCSNTVLNRKKQKNMIKRIKRYFENHKDDKILVYLGYHGAEYGYSSNGWWKEDWLELASISPNIKIMSPRCYFGSVYSNDLNELYNIYSIQSPVSGTSNKTWGCGFDVRAMRQGEKNLLGFHELEIYARLDNPIFSPLTDFIDYTDFNTGEKKHGKIPLADAGDYIQNEGDVHFG